MVDCFICLGSNFQQIKYYDIAYQRLKEFFPLIKYAPSVETTPIGLNRTEPFINQVAHFKTDYSQDDVKSYLKKIEKECDRTDADKSLEIIRMDIDLLIYGDCVLKQDDLKRSYIASGIEQLIL